LRGHHFVLDNSGREATIQDPKRRFGCSLQVGTPDQGTRLDPMNPGSIVRCRNREWVLLPADNGDVFVLRPLTGTPDDVVHVHRGLANHVGYTLPFERVTPASFPMPAADDVADAASTYLLWQAARLVLREGAAPFRSLGRISIRPRTYQFVPLLMALRLNPVRLFIADDVGVGKTIEALLIARELLDRGEIRRFCVLCPPYLCEQWARELTEKFNLEPVVIRSGTVGQLERGTPPHSYSRQSFSSLGTPAPNRPCRPPNTQRIFLVLMAHPQ
jgi:hypothetical protein